MEDITVNKLNTVQIATSSGWISSLLFDEVSQSLLVGDYSGGLRQYKREITTNAFTLVKDYGSVGLECVYSSVQVGDFCFFGGRNHRVVVIDILSRRLETVHSSFRSTYCLEVCQGLHSKVYLSLGGFDPDFGEYAFDCLDITAIHKRKKQIVDSK